ncbi:MAG: PEPxxWA-CTERM sorting domain-containing protein [Sphingomonadaceae bacterium]
MTSYDVFCDKQKVGSVFFGPVGKGFQARFQIDSEGRRNIADIARQCGQHHFNWRQDVLYARHRPVDSAGRRLTLPFLDPPLGGYGDDPNTPKADDTLWADQLPWFWNETRPPDGTPGFKPELMLEEHTGDFELLFRDDPMSPFPDQVILFVTRLVSVHEDGSFHRYHGGFLWVWRPTNGGDVGRFQAIPEPASWQLMIAGFGLLGAGLRRHRLVAALPAPARTG